jgi:hypothetical protein
MDVAFRANVQSHPADPSPSLALLSSTRVKRLDPADKPREDDGGEIKSS